MTSNRPSLFISAPLASDVSYQWMSSSMHSPSISPHSIQSSSWEIDSKIDSTPRQNHLLRDTADDLLYTSNIDQWLLGGTLDVSPSSLVETDAIKGPSVNSNCSPISSASLQAATPLQVPSDVVDTTSIFISNHIRALSAHYIPPKQGTFRVSREIVLRSLTNDPTQDIYYPQSDILQALDDKGQSVLITGGLMSFTSPPADDFMPEKGEKIARSQPEKRRCHEDIYTPLWVRGDGISREGWCSLCNPGRWLNLKTSQYLYHLQNTHGVIQTTGRFCPPPLQLRVHNDSVGTTEGWCGDCQQWISICTIRKRRSFSSWFEHSRKCRSSRKRPLMEPYHRRALSSSPAMRLRAVKKEGHQRVSSMQEMSSFIVDFSESCSSSSSSSSTHLYQECNFADANSRR